jgi:Tol biopolymer transport system component
MALNPGTRLGVYEVAAPLGAGGMGEVYRARDTNLGRAVAIKILPATLAGDAEREARFAREAQILASLNHPHIAAIYGVEQWEGTRFLVLELVDGETLAQKLKTHGTRGLAVDEAVVIARQIADALQAAHDKGIVHRDLKPANVALTAEGQVKVLDFGLAKFTGADGAAESVSPTVSQSPTLTAAATQAGMILGTAAYMSPEQARGRVADKRSDIWAFGCVLFEMLTGRRPFGGEDISDTLAAILRGDPDWALLPAELPTPLRTLVEGCLKKDRAQRVGDIAVAQFLLNQPVTTNAPAPVATRRPGASSVWTVIAAVLALTTIAATVAALYVVRNRPVPELTRFLIMPPEKGAFVTAGRTGSSVAISPDGRRLAYTVRDETGRVQIWLRPIDALTAVPLPGTDNAEFPFWSPDSRSIAFFANGKLLRIDASAGGGLPQTVCDADGARGGAWSRGDVIVYGGGTGTGLMRVPAGGGTPVALTKVDQGDHRFPSFLPDGRHVLFRVNVPGQPDENGLSIAALDSPGVKRLTQASTSAIYASPGVLLFVRDSTLMSQSFDLQTLTLNGDATPVAERVEAGTFDGLLSFSVSDTGILAYGIGSGRGNELQLTWFDRTGKPLGTVGESGNYVGLDLAPDDTRLVVHRHDVSVGGDLWLHDLVNNRTSRFTFDPVQDNSSPVFSPDGRYIAFASLRNGRFGIYKKATDGSTLEEHVDVPQEMTGPKSWSPDGTILVYETNDPTTNSDVFLLPLSGNRQPEPVAASPFNERSPAVSPDGRWIVYASDETGRPELYVKPFPAGNGKWQITSSGGVEAQWRGDSKEIFYRDSVQLGSVWAVDVQSAGNAFAVGEPRRLFERSWVVAGHRGALGLRQFAVTRDGQRFLVPANPRVLEFTEIASEPIAVVTNWAAALPK